jgi:hypothetical protein
MTIHIHVHGRDADEPTARRLSTVHANRADRLEGSVSPARGSRNRGTIAPDDDERASRGHNAAMETFHQAAESYSKASAAHRSGDREAGDRHHSRAESLMARGKRIRASLGYKRP